MRAFSQNARFTLALEDSVATENPHGHSLAIDLLRALESAGWDVCEPDNWRDVGWSSIACRDGGEVEVVLSGVGNDEWMLQIGPARGIGWVARALGSGPSASPQHCFAIAEIVHETLTTRRASIAWRWNGPPGDEASTREPREWDNAR